MKLDSIPPGLVRAALPVATILGSIVAALAIGIEIAILIVAAGALVGVVALLWASVQSLTGEAPLTLEEALGLGAPSAEEEQKRAVLRALKDLEFERSVGKISEEDYAELSARYREEAKRLMQALDQSSEPERARVDKLVQERLASAAKRPKKRLEPKAAEADGEDAAASDGDDEAPDTADAPAEEPTAAEEEPATAEAPQGELAAAESRAGAAPAEVTKERPAPREAGGESS